MSADRKPSRVRGIVHFFSAWGFGDACAVLLTSLGGMVFGRSGHNDWLTVAAGVCAIVAYGGIAILTRPPVGEAKGNDR